MPFSNVNCYLIQFYFKWLRLTDAFSVCVLQPGKLAEAFKYFVQGMGYSEYCSSIMSPSHSTSVSDVTLDLCIFMVWLCPSVDMLYVICCMACLLKSLCLRMSHQSN